MKILLLSPQPFYQERGTPIAVSLVLKVLSERGDDVDVLTYHEGRDLHYPNVRIHRIIKIPFVRNIRPGFSWKKVVCDILILFKAVSLVSKKRYQIVHAVEESVFVALVLKVIFNTPYVYDMDSSLVQQIVEKYRFLKPLKLVLKSFEGLAVRNAKAVMPVCEALAMSIEVHAPRKVVVLPDISLLTEENKLI